MRVVGITALALALVSPVMAAEAVNLDDLLNQVKAGRVKDTQEANARLEAFRKDRTNQQRLLTEMNNEQTRQEGLSARLENTFEINDEEIVVLEAALQERLGDLKELFGVLQQASGDAIGQFGSSITQTQFPERTQWLSEFAAKMGQTNRMASLTEIERLWFELQREITESGRVVRLNETVSMANGEQEVLEIVRVGPFNLAFEDGYLKYDASKKTISELQRQPEQGRYTSSAGDLVDATSGIGTFGLDVTRGSILELLVESPTVMDRIHQGGIVGYCIIGLGLIGFLIAVLRFIGLSSDSRKVSAQLKRDTASTDNPLGRVLAAYESNRNADTETIELKLSEAALKEMPGLTKGLLLIKVISVVAPLMGLLGTVTGMIKTFQVITLYGAGDPKMMAGGISQALMTTVLGLVVAIPMVLLHTVVSGQSRKVINILQSQSAGLVAEHSEKRG
jgi:biopolymer transport protein ExbB